MRGLKFYYSINWIKTVYFNFKMLPFSQAKNLPVLFYGNVKFTGLRGKLIIDKPLIEFGLVKIGYNLEIIQGGLSKTELKVDGVFVIKGSFCVGKDVAICIMHNGYLEIGEGSYLGRGTKVIVTKSVKIGKSFRFGYESQISDSNYHYTINLENNTSKRLQKNIVIGNYCWVGNRSSIMAGTITPEHLIVASNSLLNKDYAKIIPSKSLVGGIPAKLIKTEIVRVYDEILEEKINSFFNNNDSIDVMYHELC